LSCPRTWLSSLGGCPPLGWLFGPPSVALYNRYSDCTILCGCPQGLGRMSLAHRGRVTDASWVWQTRLKLDRPGARSTADRGCLAAATELDRPSWVRQTRHPTAGLIVLTTDTACLHDSHHASRQTIVELRYDRPIVKLVCRIVGAVCRIVGAPGAPPLQQIVGACRQASWVRPNRRFLTAGCANTAVEGRGSTTERTFDNRARANRRTISNARRLCGMSRDCNGFITVAHGCRICSRLC